MRTLLHKFFSQREDWSFQKAAMQESTRKLGNPSRGWYRIYCYEIEKTPSFSPMSWSEIEGDTLAMVIINIGAYKEKKLDTSALDNIRKCLQFFVDKQYEIILRITYDHEGKALEREPFFFSGVTEHLQQVIPVINEFSDHIFVYQGLMVGNWGEMHTSRFLQPMKLKELWSILKMKADPKLYFAVRRPSCWRMLHPDKVKDHMGLFDDAIFGSENHLGTFGILGKENAAWDALWKKEDELEFEEELCKYVPNGGEAICGEQYLQMENAKSTIATLRKMHITYLNKEYDKKLLSIWKEWKWEEAGIWQDSSLYDYIENHLGYRFWIKDVNIASNNNCKDSLLLKISIENVGFANCYEKMELIMESTDGEGNISVQILDADLRDCDSGCIQIVTIEIPMTESEFHLSAKRLRDNHTIYFANVGGKDGKVFLGRLHL